MHSIITISVSFLLLIVPIAVNAQKTIIGFDYPFKTGDVKWKEYKNPHERIKALQIPQTVLSKLTTEDLLNICLDFPYLSDVLMSDNDSLCVEILKEFNGFSEFIQRDDYVKVLLEKALQISDEINTIDSMSIWKSSIQCFVLSNLLQREYLNIQSNSMIKMKYDKIPFVGMSHYGIYSFIRGSNNENKHHHLRSYPGYNNVTIYTPNGTIVPDAMVYVAEDFSQDYKQSLNNDVLNNYDDVEILDDATKKYNCHGYAWHMAENGDTVWINTEEIYWQDESYVEVPEAYATKVSYAGNHSAIRLNSTWYVSKWGEYPKIKHHPNIVPYIYQPYYTKHFYIKTPQIAGSSLVCSTESYTIQNLPSGATVQWSASNSKLSLVSGQGTGTATFQKVSNGACMITAQVTLGTTTLSFTKDVWAGTPTAPTLTGWPHTNLFMENTQYNFGANGNSLAQILEYQWTVVKGATLISGGNSSNATFLMNSPGPVSIRVRARNACGWGPYTNKSGTITDDNGQIPINSPGNNILTIPLSDDGEYEIQLWNTYRMIRSTKTTKSSYDVDLSNLPSDLYIIKVLKDGRSVNQLKVKKQ